MILPDNLYDYAEDRPRRSRRLHGINECDPAEDRITVTDNWPERVPVTEAEVDVFERYFGDVLDCLFAKSPS